MFEQYPGTLEQRSRNTGLFLKAIQDTSRRANCFSVLGCTHPFLILDVLEL